MRILFLQHDPLDGPGVLLDWAQEHGCSVSTCLICEGQPLPELDSFDLLVSLGGPMGAYEEEKHPWLVSEKAYLRKAVVAGKKIVGLCLGCQLLADALGGHAYKHSLKEFGWQPIEPTEAGKKWLPLPESEMSFHAFQWHGDTYSLPPDAVQIARNDACEQQAFVIGNQVLGLQFHLEWTEAMMRDALADSGVALSMIPSPTVQTPEEIMSNLHFLQMGKKRFFDLMDRFVG
jgi:GMP synthase-like glutamine amidotransferase